MFLDILHTDQKLIIVLELTLDDLKVRFPQAFHTLDIWTCVQWWHISNNNSNCYNKGVPLLYKKSVMTIVSSILDEMVKGHRFVSCQSHHNPFTFTHCHSVLSVTGGWKKVGIRLFRLQEILDIKTTEMICTSFQLCQRYNWWMS